LAESDKVTAGERFIKVQKALDTAARKGHVHKNTAARKLSRLARRLAQVSV
jgi:ribosomal protein S20